MTYTFRCSQVVSCWYSLGQEAEHPSQRPQDSHLHVLLQQCSHPRVSSADELESFTPRGAPMRDTHFHGP
jgi:hypothetical protein